MKLIILFFSVITIMVSNNTISKSNIKIEIPSIFSDNMVLQQNSDCSFWGKAEPNLQINIEASWGENSNTTVKDDGRWLTKLKTPTAGGPFEINIQVGDSLIIYKNVLIGEVWLCSGQSNMEMPLQGWPPNDLILNSEVEITKADYPEIRFFTVPRAYSNEKEFNINGKWEECSPLTAPGFSATAYFFGKKLYEELKIPIGLIHSSWGGTPVESWMSDKYLENVDEYKTVINEIKNSSVEIQKYKEWLYTHPVIDIKNPSEDRWENLDFNDQKCLSIDFDDSQWKEMNLPTLWENTEVGNFDGGIWFRKNIAIPTSWANKDLVIELGPIDDMDRTYINGILIGAHEREGFWNTNRIYQIPKEVVKSNKVIIAIRVVDNQGGGGLFGAKEQLKIYPAGNNDSISLSGNWKYLPVAEYIGQKFFTFGIENREYYSKPALKINLSANTPTTLYNSMINPLIPYSIKGAIWYQGESNTGNPELYSIIFPLMIKNWRDDWKNDFSFYYAQIAPYNYGDSTHSERLRESQFKTLSVPNTGMVVTLDISNPNNIHPANKTEVGERLASWALAKDYSRDVPFSGPLYKSMKVDGDKIILSFDYSDGLILKELNGGNNFMIAGDDKNFIKALVEIEENNLIVFNPEIKNPVAVRYAWSNISEGTLFNEAGLPASSFRTDNWND